jgi:hypothetical protein
MKSTNRDVVLIAVFGAIALVCLAYGLLYDGGTAFLVVGYFGLIDLVGRIFRYNLKRKKTPDGKE